MGLAQRNRKGQTGASRAPVLTYSLLLYLVPLPMPLQTSVSPSVHGEARPAWPLSLGGPEMPGQGGNSLLMTPAPCLQAYLALTGTLCPWVVSAPPAPPQTGLEGQVQAEAPAPTHFQSSLLGI